MPFLNFLQTSTSLPQTQSITFFIMKREMFDNVQPLYILFTSSYFGPAVVVVSFNSLFSVKMPGNGLLGGSFMIAVCFTVIYGTCYFGLVTL